MRLHETSSPRRKAAPVASLIFISILCIINNSRWLLEVQSFAPSPPQTSTITTTLSKQAHAQQHYTIQHNINLHASKDNSDTSSSYTDDNEEDNAILNELRDKKKETYGTDIPQTDELQQAAKDAENAFLAAMLEQSQQFKEIKSEQGGDAAVSEFRRRIQKGDEDQRLENEKNDAAAAAALEDDDEGEESFVQQMNESLEEENEAENKEGKDAWQ